MYALTGTHPDNNIFLPTQPSHPQSLLPNRSQCLIVFPPRFGIYVTLFALNFIIRTFSATFVEPKMSWSMAHPTPAAKRTHPDPDPTSPAPTFLVTTTHKFKGKYFFCGWTLLGL